MCWVFFFSAVHLCAFTRRAFFFFCSVLFFFSSFYFWHLCRLVTTVFTYFLFSFRSFSRADSPWRESTRRSRPLQKEKKRRGKPIIVVAQKVKWNETEAIPLKKNRRKRRGKQCTKKHTHTHTSRTNADVLIWKHSREKKNCNNQQQQ